MKIDSGKDVDKLMKALREIAAKLSGAEEYVMVHHPAFRVGKKPFAIAGMDHETRGATVSINWGPDAQRQFLDDERFARTPYIGQHGWVTVAHAALNRGELQALVTESWKRIAGKKHLAPKPARKKMWYTFSPKCRSANGQRSSVSSARKRKPK